MSFKLAYSSEIRNQDREGNIFSGMVNYNPFENLSMISHLWDPFRRNEGCGLNMRQTLNRYKNIIFWIVNITVKLIQSFVWSKITIKTGIVTVTKYDVFLGMCRLINHFISLLIQNFPVVCDSEDHLSSAYSCKI